MENLTLIQSEQVDAIHSEIRELKELFLQFNKEAELSKWRTKPEARERLKVCQKTLDNYLKNGVIPYSRFGGKIYIKEEDIQAHLEKNYIK